MRSARSNEVWIVGATGRTGRALAPRLAAHADAKVVLVGRSAAGLHAAATALGPGVRVVALDGMSAIIDAVRNERPRVVVNLVGTYSQTALELARACMPNGAYIDLANDLDSMQALLALHDEAEQNGSTLITGAGFGVLGTEAVVARLCADRPVPHSVRVDALGSFASENGVMGDAFAQTSVDVITTGGRQFRDGRLVPVRLASNVQHLTLPDGSTVTSAAVPSGELLAAQRASGAANVDFTSALAPTAPAVRALLPLMTRVLKLPSARRIMVKQLAASRTHAAPRPRVHSWGHAIVTWPDGTVREGWLRAGDAMEFTADALAAVSTAILSGTAPNGAFTPAAAFGAQIAVIAGGTFIDR